MIATTAKLGGRAGLKELAERCEISSESRGVVQCLRCETCKKRDVRQVIPLARLVLTLSEALDRAQTALTDAVVDIKGKSECGSACNSESCVHSAICDALAAVEEL